MNIPTSIIYEKDDPVYGSTDCYHKALHVFYKDEKVNLRDLKYGKVDPKYLDPRKQILLVHMIEKIYCYKVRCKK
jgi:hypothetical protein